MTATPPVSDSGDAPPLGDLAAATAVFSAVRPRLFGIAYRMLGTVSDAEDIVQETWLRWQGYDRTTVQDPAAFLATTTTRLAINLMQSARVRRESYVGPWLPEPVDTSADPALGAERGEALSFAMLVLLEKLTPTERAAYVLRAAFDYSYAQIAEVVQSSEVSARKLFSRAKQHLAAAQHEPVAPKEQRRLLDAFIAAAQTGDLDSLERLLTEDVVSYSDGGGVVRASRIPVIGRDHVSKFVHAFAERFWQGVTVAAIEANGQPSAALSRAGSLVAVVSVVATPSGIDQVLWMMNPEKLAGLTR